MTKYILYIFFVFFLNCSSSSLGKIDFFGVAHYALQPNEKVFGYQKTPVEELFKENVAYLFSENQLPIYRIIRNDNSYIYATIPYDIDFSSFQFGELPSKARIISQNQTNDLKYISFESDSMFISVYLRKIQNNVVCLFTFATDRTNFDEIATQEVIDNRLIINEKK